MNVIIVKKDPFRNNHPSFSYPLLAISLLALFVILIGVAYVAYHYGGQQAKLAVDAAVLKSTPTVQASVSPMVTESVIMSDSERELEELASRLGDLQAQLIQLNEVSQQLITLSKLDEEEFDFTFDWEGALTEEQIIALEDLPEEIVVPEVTVAAKSDKTDKKAEAKLAEKSDKADKKAEAKLAEKSSKTDKKAEAKLAEKSGKTDKKAEVKLAEKADKVDKKAEVKLAEKADKVDKKAEAKLAEKADKVDKKAEVKKADKQVLALVMPEPVKSKNVKEITAEKLKDEKKVAIAKLSMPDVKRATEQLSKKIEERKEEIAVVEDVLLGRRGQAKVLPSGWPIKQGYFSSGFGPRGKRMHKGVDLVTKSGSNIYAVEDGEVTFSGQMRGYGNLIEIKHGGTYSTRYGHNTRNLVRVGDRVRKGQIIGLVGATGRATTAHVHFELHKNGSAINPMQFLAAINSFQLAQK